MAYAQIAQKTIIRNREDGSSVNIRITFEQDGAAAASLNIPLVEDIIVTHGDRQDQIDKPLKVSKCEMNFADVPAASDLIYRIDGAALREIRVTVENLTDSYTEFVGYVVPDRTDFQLYEDVQRVAVLATGNLQFIEEINAVDAFRTIRGMGEDVNTASALTRAIDLYTSMRHNTQALANPIPNYIRGNQKMMAGNADDSTLLEAVSGMCAVFGWQIFQRNGRLTIAEVYERAFNPTAVNRYQDNGAGVYTQGTENVRVQLTAANVIRGGKFNNTRAVTRRTQQFNLITRDTVPSIFQDANEVLYGNTNTFINTAGLIQGGDVVTVSFWGRAIATTPVDNDVNWTGEVANVTLKSVIGGPDVEILSVTPNVAFLTGGSNEFSWGNTGTPVVFEVPEGFIGTIEAKHIFQGGTFADGTAADLEKSVADKLTIGVAPADGGVEELYHFFDAASTDPLGQLITRSFFLADEDQYSVQQAFQFSTDGFSFANTTTWIDAGGNDTLPAVTARRLGDVVVGSGLKFSVQLRDADRVDLMTVFTIVDNNGVTHTCLPLEIKHSVLKGFYSVRMREVFDQRSVAADSDLYALEPRGSTTSGASSSGGGGSSGAVWGAITGTLAAQTDLQSALNAKADQTDLDNHVNSTSNPHSVTPTQIGAVAKTGVENIGGVKTFTSISVFNAGLRDASATAFSHYPSLNIGETPTKNAPAYLLLYDVSQVDVRIQGRLLGHRTVGSSASTNDILFISVAKNNSVTVHQAMHALRGVEVLGISFVRIDHGGNTYLAIKFDTTTFFQYDDIFFDGIFRGNVELTVVDNSATSNEVAVNPAGALDIFANLKIAGTTVMTPSNAQSVGTNADVQHAGGEFTDYLQLPVGVDKFT